MRDAAVLSAIEGPDQRRWVRCGRRRRAISEAKVHWRVKLPGRASLPVACARWPESIVRSWTIRTAWGPSRKAADLGGAAGQPAGHLARTHSTPRLAIRKAYRPKELRPGSGIRRRPQGRRGRAGALHGAIQLPRQGRANSPIRWPSDAIPESPHRLLVECPSDPPPSSASARKSNRAGHASRPSARTGQGQRGPKLRTARHRHPRRDRREMGHNRDFLRRTLQSQFRKAEDH